MCALLAGGAVKCWGWNGYGQLGTGDTTNRLTPTAVGAGRPARSVQILMLQLNKRNLAVMLLKIELMKISSINHVRINCLSKTKNSSCLYFVETLLVLDSLSKGSVHECAFKCTVDSDCYAGYDLATGDRSD